MRSLNRTVAYLIATVIAVTPIGTANANFLRDLFSHKAELWARWSAHDESSKNAIGHGDWDKLLIQYLKIGEDGINRVDYTSLKAGSMAMLNAYVQRLEAVEISTYARAEQLAFWINLYNAATVQIVANHYPVDSIRDIDISPGLFANGPWGQKFLTVEGVELSLNDIEHRILRPIWQDPRIHYVVNCAALGCPNLQPNAFTGEMVDRMLFEAAQEFVNHPRAIAVDDGKLVLSSIFEWYAVDFGESAADLRAHLSRYANAEQRALLGAADGATDYRYDWALNDAKLSSGTPKSRATN